jgi:GT2 family glycosyltransferase
MTNSLNNGYIGSALPSIGFLILNQNGERWLPPLYDSLRHQAYPQLKIYLVDNASTDSSVSLTQERYPEVKILRLSQNAGYCIAYNRSMPIAFSDGCEWVIWANNDLILEPGCLLAMGRLAAEHRDIGVIGPTFWCWESNEPNYYMTGKHPRALTAMKNRSDIPFDVDWVEGSFLMVSERCISDVGWLDPFLFFYWEEADFCRRAIRKGWRIVLAPNARARHFGGGTSFGSKGSVGFGGRLKSRNQYIHVLANPGRSFALNLIGSAHLFLVLTRDALKNSRSTCIYELRVFLSFLTEIGAIWHKWRRDRRGLPPEPTTLKYAHIGIEVVGTPSTRTPKF